MSCEKIETPDTNAETVILITAVPPMSPFSNSNRFTAQHTKFYNKNSINMNCKKANTWICASRRGWRTNVPEFLPGRTRTKTSLRYEPFEDHSTKKQAETIGQTNKSTKYNDLFRACHSTSLTQNWGVGPQSTIPDLNEA